MADHNDIGLPFSGNSKQFPLLSRFRHLLDITCLSQVIQDAAS
jgi:hypothetical protein